MVQVNQAMINPQVASADYSKLTAAVIRGQDVELQASKEKNARIRASLAEVTMNNKASADAQATWMAAIKQNESLLNALDKAPPRIQKAYNKATQGRATLEDNSVISAYLGSVQQQIGLKQATEDNQLNNDLTTAKIDQANAARDASKASAMVSNAELGALNQTGGISPEQRLAQAIAGVPSGAPGSNVNVAGGSPLAPPTAAIDATDPSDPMVRPVAGAMIPQGAPATTPQAPVVTPQAPVAAPVATPEVAPVSTEVDPNAPVFTNSEGEVVTADPQVVNSAEVNALVQEKGVSVTQATQRVQANQELAQAEEKYVYGDGNIQILPTYKQYTSELVASGVDPSDADKIATSAADRGEVYVPLTSQEERKRKEDFAKSWKSESSGLVSLLLDTNNMHDAAERIYSNLLESPSGGTSGFWGKAQGKTGLDFVPDGASSVEVAKAVSQLRSDSALKTIVELKEASTQGATGLGQVSVVEFTSLIESGNTISQDLPNQELREATQRYIYERNKTAYNTYQSMVDQYGLSAVNSISGVSARQLGNILKDINTHETTTTAGMATVARNGSYAGTIEMPQKYTVSAQQLSPEQQQAVRESDIAQAEDTSTFTGRDMNRKIDADLQNIPGSRIPGFNSPLNMATSGNVLRFFNIIPDYTDQQYVEQRTRDLMQNSQTK
jgi:hypothetical protein